MKNYKAILLEITKLFFIILFANWLVSLGDDKPFLSENPIRWLAICVTLSIIGGYGQYKFMQRYDNKDKQMQPKDPLT